MGYSPWGSRESDTTEGSTQLTLSFPEVGGFRTASVFLCLCSWVSLPLTGCKDADGLLFRVGQITCYQQKPPPPPPPRPSQQPGTGLEKDQ